MPDIVYCQVDDKGRVELFEDLVGQMVTVERVDADEIRIRRASAHPKKYTLDELLAHVTPDQLHGETSTGPAVGNEVL